MPLYKLHKPYNTVDVEIGVLEAFLNTVALGVRNEKFKADHVWVVISAIVKSEFGYFSYRSLKGQLGESLNRMITDNLFYLRHPFDNWSSDIGDLTESVVTAINKPALNALKDLSKEEFESSAK